MAIVQNPVTGRAKQKYGPAIFQKWKNKNVMRTLPLQVANPRSPKQIFARMALTMIVNIGRPVLDLIRIGFKSLAFDKTEFNSFISENRSTVITGAAPDEPTVNMEYLVLSKGAEQPDIQNCTVVWDQESSLTANVSLQAPGNDNWEDLQLYMAVFKDDGTYITGASGDFGTPIIGSATVVPPSDFVPNCRGVVFYYNPVTDRVCDSVNVEVIPA